MNQTAADPRVELAQDGTSMAKFRTGLALDRTTLAWIRTTLTWERLVLALLVSSGPCVRGLPLRKRSGCTRAPSRLELASSFWAALRRWQRESLTGLHCADLIRARRLSCRSGP